MAVEYICAECGEPRTLLTANEPPLCGICVACVFQPGWFRDEDLRATLAPQHDGLELVERMASAEGSSP